ncbi:hypothetical protein LINPERHAP1_LOCUS29949 [Linum perenne]
MVGLPKTRITFSRIVWTRVWQVGR